MANETATSNRVQHTLGPWACENARAWDHQVRPEWRGRSVRIYAEDPGPKNDFTIGFVCDVDEETRKVRARLIAAAPDMLRALKSIDRALTGGGSGKITPDSAEHYQLREAIDKATGE